MLNPAETNPITGKCIPRERRSIARLGGRLIRQIKKSRAVVNGGEMGVISKFLNLSLMLLCHSRGERFLLRMPLIS